VTVRNATPDNDPGSPLETRVVRTPRLAVTVELMGARGASRRRVDSEWFGIGVELGESPVWLSRRGLMACVDIDAGTLHLLDPCTGRDEIVRLPQPASALIPIGDRVVVLAVGRRLDEFRIDSRGVGPSPDRPGLLPGGLRMNDGKVDRAGRIWVGARRKRGAPGDGSVLCWESGRRPQVRVSGLTGPNGLYWDVAGDRLYVADSRQRVIYAYRFDHASGSVSDSSTFTSWEAIEGRPDGITVDVEDHVWCAAWDAGCVRRYDPLGRLEQTLMLPAQRPTSCIFGGPGLDRLWVTTARTPGGHRGDLGGGLFAIDVGTIGYDPAAVEPQ
jgi:sugar lactone lactonase YvrE